MGGLRTGAVAAVFTGALLGGFGTPALAQGPEQDGAATVSTGEPGTAPDDPTSQVWLKLTPDSGRPGTTVAVQAACEAGEWSQAQSPVLAPAELTRNREGHQPWALHGTTRVAPDAAAGEYVVTFTCGGQTVRTTFTVVGQDGPGGVAPPPTTEPMQALVAPRGAVEAGAGDVAGADERTGIDRQEVLLTVAALVAAAGTVGVVVLRRRMSGR